MRGLNTPLSCHHRFMASDLPLLAIVAGGVLFGIGMVLTRGCVSRLTVLSGSGNLRALLVLLVFAVVAHAAIKGVLAPLRTSIGAVTVPLDNAALPGNPMIWAALIAIAGLAFALRSDNKIHVLILAGFLGLLAPIGWIGTGFILYDDFDPIVMQSLAFTAPSADALFYTLASTAISPSFGAALIAGVLVGALLSSLVRSEFQWQSFETPRQTGRYLTGAAMMGVGGALAGGCTVGAGLSGVPTLSIAALLAIGSIASGALIADRALRPATGATATVVPAE